MKKVKTLKDAIEIIMAQPPELHYPAYFANLLREADVPGKNVGEIPSKREQALRLLAEWAVECGFGYDNFPEEYERYKDEVKDMNYVDGMIHIAERVIEDGE